MKELQEKPDQPILPAPDAKEQYHYEQEALVEEIDESGMSVGEYLEFLNLENLWV